MLSTAFIYLGLLRCARPHVPAFQVNPGLIYQPLSGSQMAEATDDGQGNKAGYGEEI